MSNTHTASATVRVTIELSWPHTVSEDAPMRELRTLAEKECLAALVEKMREQQIRIIGTPIVTATSFRRGGPNDV